MLRKHYIATFIAIRVAIPISAAWAEASEIGLKPGVDQEVVAVLPSNSGMPLVLRREFLEPRKAQVNPARAASDTLEVVDQLTGKAAHILNYKANNEFWIGPTRLTARDVSFAARVGTEPVALFEYRFGEGSVRRLSLPWELQSAQAKSKGYSHVFLMTNGVIGIRSEDTGQVAEAWLKDRSEPLPIPLGSLLKNDDRQVLSVEDEVEVDDRVLFLLLVTSNEPKGQGEVWLVSFDRGLTRANATALRLNVGTMTSGMARFIRSADTGVGGMYVLVRPKWFARPTLKLFKLGRSNANPIWSLKLPHVEDSRTVVVGSVCDGSYGVVRRIENGQGKTAELQFSVVSNKGQEVVIDRMKMAESRVAVTPVAIVQSQDHIWTYINFSQFEDARRPDGWYSWQGYQAYPYPVNRVCKQ